jgi:hypothetical protein
VEILLSFLLWATPVLHEGGFSCVYSSNITVEKGVIKIDEEASKHPICPQQWIATTDNYVAVKTPHYTIVFQLPTPTLDGFISYTPGRSYAEWNTKGQVKKITAFVFLNEEV